MAILPDAPAGAVVLDLGLLALPARRLVWLPVRLPRSSSWMLASLRFGLRLTCCALRRLAGHIKEGLARLLADPADVEVLVDGGISER
jgi:hypothetical protein